MACACAGRAGRATAASQTAMPSAACQIALDTASLTWTSSVASVTTSGQDQIVPKVGAEYMLSCYNVKLQQESAMSVALCL